MEVEEYKAAERLATAFEGYIAITKKLTEAVEELSHAFESLESFSGLPPEKIEGIKALALSADVIGEGIIDMVKVKFQRVQ